MKTDRNMMNKFEYLGFSSSLALLSCILYKMVLFVPIASVSYDTSETIWWALCTISFSLLTLFVINTERNGISLFITMVLPNGFYTLICYFELFPSLCYSSCAALCCALLVLIIRPKYPYVTNIAKTTSSVLFSLMLIITFYLTAQGGIQKAQPQRITSRIMIADKIEDLVKFKPETWNTLSIEERLDLLQIVADIETSDLGLSSPLQVIVDRFEDKNTLAAYDSKTQRAAISIEHIRKSPPKDVLCSILHEVHHAYQYDQMEIYYSLPDSLKRSKLLEDARRYIRDNDPFLNYEDKSYEQDAYLYSQKKCEVYWTLIFL